MRTLYCWVLSKEVSSTIFKVFGMTRPEMELRSPGPLANTLPARSMGRYWIILALNNIEWYNINNIAQIKGIVYVKIIKIIILYFFMCTPHTHKYTQICYTHTHTHTHRHTRTHIYIGMCVYVCAHARLCEWSLYILNDKSIVFILWMVSFLEFSLVWHEKEIVWVFVQNQSLRHQQ